MSMNWPDERYVRLYTRDTPSWLMLSFPAQGLFCLLLRKVDRAGTLELGRAGTKGVGLAIGHVHQWSMLEPALNELLADGCVQIRGDSLVVPNFVEAQEAEASDKARARKSRETRRDKARAGAVTGNTPTPEPVTPPTQTVTPESQTVTQPSRVADWDVSARDVSVTERDQTVTPNRAVPPVPPVPEKKPRRKKSEEAPHPQHHALVDALVTKYAEIRCADYGFNGRDAKAVSDLLRLAGGQDVPSIAARFGRALQHRGFPTVNTIPELVTHWNAFPPPAPVQRRSDVPWPQKLTDAEEEAFLDERQRIVPTLDRQAPLSVTLVEVETDNWQEVPALKELVTRYRLMAEGR